MDISISPQSNYFMKIWFVPETEYYLHTFFKLFQVIYKFLLRKTRAHTHTLECCLKQIRGINHVSTIIYALRLQKKKGRSSYDFEFIEKLK